MIIKNGVVLAGLKLPMRKVLRAAANIWKEHGEELVITSGLDGTHSAGSYHYYGYAVDLRTHYFQNDVKYSVAKILQATLGEAYTVIAESNHIHVQYNADKYL